VAQRRMLTETDREEISRGIVEGLEVQVIVARIGRSPSVVSRDIARHGGRDGYRAVAAQRAATEHRSRPKTRKIDADPGLRQRVVDKLRAGASPDQIAGRLRYEHPGQHAAWVAHCFHRLTPPVLLPPADLLALRRGRSRASGRAGVGPVRRGDSTWEAPAPAPWSHSPRSPRNARCRPTRVLQDASGRTPRDR
jgi:transposase, IS30 family